MRKQQKAWLLLVVLVLSPVMGWSALGFPMDDLSLGAVVSSVLAGVVLFAKVMLGEEDESGKGNRKGKKAEVKT